MIDWNYINSKKVTNKPWNDSKYNALYCVGGVMEICRRFRPKTHRELFDRYIETGNEFSKLLKTRAKETQEIFSCPAKIREKAQKNQVYGDFFKESRNYGRDKEFITKLAEEFADECHLDLEEAKKQVYDRLFIETFNGFQNEKLVIEEFNKRFHQWFIVEEADSSKDAKYAIDLVIKNAKTGLEIGAIQVKPISYLLRNDEVMQITKGLNERKNTLYGRPVYYVFYNNHEQPGKTKIEMEEGLKQMLLEMSI